jgi:hypothetical protein
MITVILNGYKRPHALKEQYEAVKAQTVDDVKIMFWGNHHEGSMEKFPKDIIESCTSAFCNENLGVWARFAFALNADTKFVCMLDDDTIPGKKWLENCLVTMQSHVGLLGCRGVRMTGDDAINYPSCQYTAFGAANPSNEVEPVDIMGHCWFFEREWLRAYWAEMPDTRLQSGGEDMHFSYVMQKHYGLKTYVPPHPADDKEMWGSTSPEKYGEDMAATSRTGEGHTQANSYWQFIMSQGYKLVKDM